MPVVLLIFVKTTENQKPIFIFISYLDWLQKKRKESEQAASIQNASQEYWSLISIEE